MTAVATSDGGRSPERALARKREMERLIKRNPDGVTPSILLKAAANPSSPFHGDFQWNQTEAAESYRLLQAASLIRRYQVYVTRRSAEVRDVSVSVLKPIGAVPETTRSTRGLISIKGKYRDLETVLNTPELAEEYEAIARRDAIAFRNRWRFAKTLAHVMAAIDALGE